MSLRVWLPLNKDLRNQGLSNVTVTQNGGTFTENSCRCSVSNYPIWNYTIDTTNTFSLAFWIKIPSELVSPSSWQVFIQFATNTGSDTTAAIKWATYNNLKIYDNGTHQCFWKNMSYDTWVHLAITNEFKNDTYTCKLYINGVLNDTATNTTELKIRSGSLVLGNITQANTYVGFYDFRIYDHALSKKEVKELSKGLYLHYTFANPYVENTLNLVSSITAGGQTTVSNGVVTTSGVSADTYFTINLSETISIGTQYTISCETDMPSGTYWDFPLGAQGNTDLTWRLKPGYNTYTFTANNISWGTQRIFMDDTGGTARTSGYQCKFWNFQLEKKDHATPYTPSLRTSATVIRDNSGFGNDGTINGNLQVLSGSARGSYCTKFSGNEYIDVGKQIYGITDAITVSCWCKFTGGNMPRLLSCTESGGWNFEDYYSDGRFNFAIYTTIGNYGDLISSEYVNDNKWHMITGTFDGRYKKIYTDGVLSDTEDLGATYKIQYNQNVNLYVGRESPSGNNANWCMSDVRIYKTALSASDIKDLYQTGFAIDKNQNLHCYEIKETNMWEEIARVTNIGTSTVNIDTTKYDTLGFFVVGGGGSGHGDFNTAWFAGGGGNGGCVNSFIVPCSGSSVSVTVGAGGAQAASRANSNSGNPSTVTYDGKTYTSNGGYGGVNNKDSGPVKQENSGAGGWTASVSDSLTQEQKDEVVEWRNTHTYSESITLYGGTLKGMKGEDGLPNPFDPLDNNLYGAGGGGSYNTYGGVYQVPSAPLGGVNGGGNGGYGNANTSTNAGKSATFYGGAGGGGSFASSHTYSTGGAGYQGIVIIYGTSKSSNFKKTGTAECSRFIEDNDMKISSDRTISVNEVIEI